MQHATTPLSPVKASGSGHQHAVDRHQLSTLLDG
jgi:hypothetical protein